MKDQRTLTNEQISAFNSDGYIRLEKVFTPEEVAVQSKELERLMQEFGEVGLGWQGDWREQIMAADEASKAQLMLLADLERYSEAYFRAVTHPTIVGAVADLLGTSVEFDHSILHAKAPNLGTPFPMHQDWPFYAHWTDRFVDVLLHIDTANEENGCLRFVPGSHKLGPLEHVFGTNKDGSPQEPYLPTKDYPLENAVMCPADAGDVVIMSYLTIHGSAPNRTNRWRRLIRVGYRDPANEWARPDDPTWPGPRHKGNHDRIGRPNGIILRGSRSKVAQG